MHAWAATVRTGGKLRMFLMEVRQFGVMLGLSGVIGVVESRNRMLGCLGVGSGCFGMLSEGLPMDLTVTWIADRVRRGPSGQFRMLLC